MKDKIKKHWLLAIIGVMLIVVTGYGLTSAYLSASSTRTNTITIGENKVQIVEDFDKPQHYQPNTAYKKVVQVKNTGTVPCYVRVFVNSSSSDVPAYFNIDTTNWTKKADGYYYFNNILDANTQTPPLFTHVSIGNADISDLKSFDVIVYVESVQSYGYSNIDAAFADMEG